MGTRIRNIILYYNIVYVYYFVLNQMEYGIVYTI